MIEITCRLIVGVCWAVVLPGIILAICLRSCR